MKRFFSLLGLAGLLVAAGCRKDDPIVCAPVDVPTPPTPIPPSPLTSNTSLAKFRGGDSNRYQSFSIALDAVQTITTRSGATLTFPANYFTSLNGPTAPDSALVQVRTLYTVPEILLADVPTGMFKSANLLVSAGEFDIQVQQFSDSQHRYVRLAANANATSQLTLSSPIPNGQGSQPQQLWQQPVTQGTRQGWQTSPAYPAVQPLPLFYQASIPLDSVGWWSIGHPWPAATTTSLTPIVVATPATAAGETRVYMRPAGVTGLLRLAATSSDETHWQATLPLGAPMQVIVLQTIAGQLYFGAQLFTVQSAGSVTPALTPVSEAEAVRLIQQL